MNKSEVEDWVKLPRNSLRSVYKEQCLIDLNKFKFWISLNKVNINEKHITIEVANGETFAVFQADSLFGKKKVIVSISSSRLRKKLNQFIQIIDV